MANYNCAVISNTMFYCISLSFFLFSGHSLSIKYTYTQGQSFTSKKVKMYLKIIGQTLWKKAQICGEGKCSEHLPSKSQLFIMGHVDVTHIYLLCLLDNTLFHHPKLNLSSSTFASTMSFWFVTYSWTSICNHHLQATTYPKHQKSPQSKLYNRTSGN